MNGSNRVSHSTGDTPPTPHLSPTAAAAGEDGRLPALDFLRVAAMVMVVVVHGSMPYVRLKIRQLLWSVREAGPDLLMDAITWWILGTALPIFFVISGYAAASIHERRGTRGFLRDRWRRVTVPFLAAIPAVLLPTLLVWSYGWYRMGRSGPRVFLALCAPDPLARANRFGPAHLWFLEYLIVWLVVYAAARWLLGVVRRDGGARGAWGPRWLSSPVAPVVLSVPTTVILWANHEWYGLDAVMDMRNSFWINITRWLHHGVFFLVGVGLSGRPAPWERLARWGPWHLAVSIPAFLARGWFLQSDLAMPVAGSRAWMVAGTASLFGWLSLYGCLGSAIRWWGKRSGPVLRYLADASFWVYLVHFPIMGLTQANLFSAPWPVLAKFGISVTVGLGLSLLTYQACVRHTAIGRWLHGPRLRARWNLEAVQLRLGATSGRSSPEGARRG